MPNPFTVLSGGGGGGQDVLRGAGGVKTNFGLEALLPSFYKDSLMKNGGADSPLPSFLTQNATGGLDGTSPYRSSGYDYNNGTNPNNTGNQNIQQLTDMVNSINQAAQQRANQGRIPGDLGLEQQSSGNIASALAGQVDPSTINLLGQQAAERGVSTGSPMGASNNAAYLKALGLTSLDRQNIGQDWLSRAVARNPAAPIYDAGNQVLTAQQLQQAILERENMANQLRIAQLHYGRGSGGGGNVNIGGRSGGSTGTGSTGPSTNWADLLLGSKPAAPGWSFPPGYENIPVGGTSVGGGAGTDQEFEDYVFGIPGGFDQGGISSLDDQFDFNFDDALENYA